MPLPTAWLPALAAFEAAARHQNFAHAAEELHLTASAVSHHVRKLEGLLGVTLFQRHARGVSLTIEGRQLSDAAQSALADIDDVMRDLGDTREERHRVRITTMLSLAHTWLLPRLPDFTSAHPHVRVRIDTEMALTSFDEGGPDLGIRYGLGHWPGMTAHHLMPDAMFPVASPDLPGVEHVSAPADIQKLPLVGDHARQSWQDWFRAAEVHGARIDVRYSFSDTTNALLAAARGLGAALARDKVSEPFLSNGSLVRLPGPSLPTRYSYFVVYPSHRRLRAAARTFVDWVLTQPGRAPPPPVARKPPTL
ncbi:LysR family transcriptional regulator [Myxococcus sp. CA051A]|uniref:LysR substrate-binding domain-containing protein n=1 Tax=Myxococcus sp. CA051A TaxID=2741739 RepID=UPI00157A9146|nr:LysR substrate-binding domain-containing protein [Myxococcus sp. CA051A]NTX67481.1 LysR family transcriptional regulator [Myxococcus sp. CA051A]